MDETYIKVKGAWKYLCRAVDKKDKTVDLFTFALALETPFERWVPFSAVVF